MFHILATPILKERQLCKQRGLGFGGSQIFSLRSRQNFNPSNPVSWQKKSTIHFSKAPTKTVRAWIPSILGTIHFFIYKSPPPPTHSPPPPQEWRVLELGSLDLLFQKRQQFFLSCGQFFQTCHQKVNPSECTNEILGVCSRKSFMFHLCYLCSEQQGKNPWPPILKAGFQ